MTEDNIQQVVAGEISQGRGVAIDIGRHGMIPNNFPQDWLLLAIRVDHEYLEGLRD